MALENLFNYSITSNNLLNISLVKDSETPGYKRQHFVFVSMSPGSKTDSGGRTYNTQNKITMKVEIDKVLELSHALRIMASGKGSYLKNSFMIFADSSKSGFGGDGGSKKILGMVVSTNQRTELPQINFYIKYGGTDNSINIPLSLPGALSLADVFEFIGKKALELEYLREDSAFQRQDTRPKTFNNRGNGANTSAPTPVGSPEKVASSFEEGLSSAVSVPFGIDDDSPF